LYRSEPQKKLGRQILVTIRYKISHKIVAGRELLRAVTDGRRDGRTDMKWPSWQLLSVTKQDTRCNKYFTSRLNLGISLGITAVSIRETFNFYWASGKMMARRSNRPHGLTHVWKMTMIKMFDCSTWSKQYPGFAGCSRDLAKDLHTAASDKW